MRRSAATGPVRRSSIITLDFEASGLGELTYPIEIGLAWQDNHSGSIETWSTLIRPCEAWRDHRIWNPASELIHGLRLPDLEDGASPHEAMSQANMIVGDATAYCDGGEHDLRWLRHLAHAAGIRPTIELADWHLLFAGNLAGMREAERWISGQSIPHRAAADARLLLQAILHGLSASKTGKQHDDGGEAR